MLIRVASKLDAKKISILSAETFNDTYAQQNKPENTQKHIKRSFSEEKIVEELASEQIIYLLGEINSEIIGYVKLNRDKIESGIMAESPIELERIYFLGGFHGKGLGKKLIDASIQLAKYFKHDKLWLGVWENNTKAIKFYESYGFILVGEHTFMFGNEPQKDLLFEIHLTT